MKNVKRIVLAAMLLLFVSVNYVEVNAKELSTFQLKNNNSVIETGELEDGTTYTVYSAEEYKDSNKPNFTVGKKFTISIIFDGNVVPPSTWSTTIKEGTVNYSGVLYLDGYSYDNTPWDKKTVARYTGTLCGQL